MRAMVWKGPRQMVLEEAPHPQPAPGEVLIRVAAVGICGSELSGYLGHNSLRRPPLIMGHEFSGTVVGVGPEAGTIRPGTRVTVNPLLSCEECRLCRGGYPNLCPRRALIGVHRPGAFAEYVTAPAKACHPLPEGVSPEQGSLAEPLACSLRAVGLGGVEPGSNVIVLGAGPIGLFAAAAALRAGAAWVAITDNNPARLAVAKAWGVHRTVDVRGEATPEVVRSEADTLGADVVIDAVGRSATRREAVRALRPGGKAVFIGLHEDEASLEGNYMVRNEIQITGCFAYTKADFSLACDLIAQGFLPPEQQWAELRPLEAGPGAFADLVDTQVLAVKILLQL